MVLADVSCLGPQQTQYQQRYVHTLVWVNRNITFGQQRLKRDLRPTRSRFVLGICTNLAAVR